MTDETPHPAKRSRKRTLDAADAAPAAEVVAVDHGGAPSAVAEDGPTPAPAPESAPAPVPPASSVGSVSIASLRLERGGIAEATADRVEVRMGGIGALDADEVFVQWGGVGAAKAQRVGVEFGSVGAAMAGEIHVTQGFAGSVLAREATIEQGIVRTLVAQRVHIARPSAVLVMIAQHVSGEVRPLLDWRGALAFGAAFGLVSGLLKLVRRRS
jgi:hypothetical protein